MEQLTKASHAPSIKERNEIDYLRKNVPEKADAMLKHLEECGLVNDLVKLMYEMFQFDELPADINAYVKNNIGHTNKEVLEAERELQILKDAIAKIEEENLILTYKLQIYEPSDVGSGSWPTTAKSE